MQMRPYKAQTVVFGCQCTVHEIVQEDDLMSNFRVSLSQCRRIPVSSQTNLSFEREKTPSPLQWKEAAASLNIVLLYSVKCILASVYLFTQL